MIVRRGQEFEFGEDVGDMGLDCLGGEEQPVADRLVRATFSHQPKDFAFSLGQVVKRDSGVPSSDELGHDLRIDDGAAARDPPDCVDEIVQVIDPVLQQVTDATCSVGH